MRVLILTSERPPVVSGIARTVAQIGDGLTALGHDVDMVAAVDFPRLVLGEFRFTGVVPRWNRLAQRLPAYDVINVHGPVPTMSDALLPLIRALPGVLRPPVVYTHHCSIELEGLRALSRSYNGIHERLTRYVDHVVVSSPSYAERIARRSPTPVSIVPWGVDPTAFPSVQRRLRPAGEPLRVVFIGQMRPYKGVPELVEAVRGEDRLRLEVIGKGPLLERYRELAGDARNIRFLGRVSDQELARAYAQSDVVVLPSTTTAEAYGLVLLEGMSSGCVPVASDLPGVRDLAGPTGRLVRPGDSLSLHHTLLDLYADPDLVLRLSRASMERAAELTPESVAVGYEAVLRRVVRQWQSAHLRLIGVDEFALAARAHHDFGADAVAVSVFDRTRLGNLRACWDVHHDLGEPGTPLLAAPIGGAGWGPRVAALTGQPLVLDAPEEGAEGAHRWRAGSEMHVPIHRAPGCVTVLSLGRSSDRPRWQLRDVAPVVARAVPLLTA